MDGALSVASIVLLTIAAWFAARSKRLGAAGTALLHEKQQLERVLADLEEQRTMLAHRLSAVIAENQALVAKYKRIDANMSALAEENRALARYRSVLDLEVALENTRRAIVAESESAKQTLDQERAQARSSISAQLASAAQESEQIIERARQQATAMAGKALEAKNNLDG